ncbi:conserved hypothetical protein [Pediculus humanus corporis]|uniref:Uncharacterized protein n=1 Tax=Pediculus humanus subsp. corporis TaxID=121224 RepID=E0VK27_PEDHC|nr:uncharacterized protein Phum_PHUM255330 [Pediculus humanus corporis]EEB13733.1 conserved hypothetical protein [Pediculus humanus corporis]
MSVKEICDVQYESTTSTLDETVENVVQVEKLDEKNQCLIIENENKKKYLQQLEIEKSQIDGQLTAMKLRNAACQKEHINLRNGITVVKYQIEKIKEKIDETKKREIKDLEEFEKTVDEITEKFKSGSRIYNREKLMEKIKEENDKREELVKKINDVKENYLNYLKENGLNEKKNGDGDDDDDLIDCINSNSELFSIREMTKTLDKVIFDIKNLIMIMTTDTKNDGIETEGNE